MSNDKSVEIDHRGTYCCIECGTDVRAGKINDEYGLFCGCTVAHGRPFKMLNAGTLPWPDRWELEEYDDC